jgi:UV DNA damage repair endonuclease
MCVILRLVLLVFRVTDIKLQGGGTYDDKAAAIERIKDSIQNKLPANVRARLVLENDEASPFPTHLAERPN